MPETGPRAAVWVATARLHQDHPDREAFEVGEIQERAGEEGLVERPERLEVHATVQCVANMRPNPGNERYIYATRDGGRRLFRTGDDFHPERAEGPTTPEPDELPEDHRPLLEWYREEYDEDAEEEVPEEVGAYGYKVLRAGSSKEAEAALGRLGAEGWRLREAVPVASEGPGDDVWLILERET